MCYCVLETGWRNFVQFEVPSSGRMLFRRGTRRSGRHKARPFWPERNPKRPHPSFDGRRKMAPFGIGVRKWCNISQA